MSGLQLEVADLRPLRGIFTSDRPEAAVATYRRSGYREVPAYHDNPEARLWFEERLDA